MALETVILPIGLFIGGICIGILIDWKKRKKSDARAEEMNNLIKQIGNKLGIDQYAPLKEYREIINKMLEGISETKSSYEDINIHITKDGDNVSGTITKDEI